MYQERSTGRPAFGRDAVYLLAAWGTLALAGCHGAGTAAVPPRGAAAATQAAVRIAIPRPPAAARARGLRFVSPAVRSAAIQVNGGTAQVFGLTASDPGCSAGTAGVTCTFTVDAPAASDTFAVSLYDGAAGSGNLLGVGQTTATIAANALTPVGITVGGVVASVALTLANTTPLHNATTTIALTVTAADADGNVIVVDPYATPITLTDSDSSGATQLSATTVSSPAQTVSVTYNGAQLPNATFSATVSGAAGITVQTATLTPKTTSTLDWTTFGFDKQRTGYNPNETVCCTSTPTKLWSKTLAHPYLTAEPVFAANVFTTLVAGGAYVDIVYVADNHGDLYALNAANGNVVWQKTLGSQPTSCHDMPDTVFGITGTPYLDRTDNRLYVVDGAGMMWALDPATGNVAPGWPASGLSVVTNVTLDHVYGGLNLDSVHGIIPVPTASYCDDGHWNGALRFVSVGNATTAPSVLNTFVFGSGHAGNYGGGMWGMGGVSLDPTTQDVIGASGNIEPNENNVYSNSVLRWTSGPMPAATPAATWEYVTTNGDSDFGAIPSLFPSPDGKLCAAVENKTGAFLIFDSANIGNGPATTVALGNASSDAFNTATPSYLPSAATVYITTGVPGNSAYPPGVYAFPVQNGCTIPSAATWGAQLPPAGGTEGIASPVTVANGFIFVAKGTTVYAFSAANGTLVWSTTASASDVFAGITVVDGMMFTAGWDGVVNAFVPPGNAPNSQVRRAAAVKSAR